MRAVVQRVSSASVTVGDMVTGRIGPGFLIYLGVMDGDTDEDLVYIFDKITNLRIFNDNEGKMNCSIGETGGEFLIVSQFTLCGDCRKGRRPSFSAAAAPDTGKYYYLALIDRLKGAGFPVQAGVFGAHMQVSCINDGPVTMLLDSRKVF
jgi:D-tyrosyl-tRNA(Tyr) deacylase